MNVCIVGHGPSPIGKKLGSKIDSFDIVVRLKNCAPLIGTEDYGSRTDVICMSTEVIGLWSCAIPAMYWLYPKKGYVDSDKVIKGIGIGAPFMLPMDLCNSWNQRFRDLGATHPNVSTGLAAIIIAAHYFEPKEIFPIGFDTLANPEIPFSRNEASPRTGVGVINHDWEKENELLFEHVQKTYKFILDWKYSCLP